MRPYTFFHSHRVLAILSADMTFVRIQVEITVEPVNETRLLDSVQGATLSSPACTDTSLSNRHRVLLSARTLYSPVVASANLFAKEGSHSIEDLLSIH